MNNKSQISSNKSNMFENVKKHFLEAESLPAACYKDRDFYNAEIEMVFLKSWLFVGRQEKLPCNKSYFVVDLLNESLLITKDENGDIHAFQNICRHRGARLLDDNGTIKHIRCPYHNWAYSLTGELIGAPDMQKTKNFCKKKKRLNKGKNRKLGRLSFYKF